MSGGEKFNSRDAVPTAVSPPLGEVRRQQPVEMVLGRLPPHRVAPPVVRRRPQPPLHRITDIHVLPLHDVAGREAALDEGGVV
jgi:hypothetical protein